MDPYVNDDDKEIDQHFFSTLLLQLYGCVTKSNWQSFLESIMHATNSNKAFISIKNAEENCPLYINYATNFEYKDEAILYYQQHPFDDPFYKDYVRFLPEGETIEPELYINIDDYKDTEFSKKVLVPMRSHHVLGILLVRDELHDAFFVLNRGHDEAPYTSKEKALIELLKPHLQHAVKLFTLFNDVSKQNDILRAVLNQSDKALLLIDYDAKIRFTNQQADTILPSLPYWQTNSNRFRLKNAVEHARFTTLLHQACRADTYAQERIYLQLTESDLQICLALSPLNWMRLDESTENLCLLTITSKQTIGWLGFKAEYELTTRETELAQALYDNQKLKDITLRMGVSYHTLRKHLQTIFAKCRVNSQSELMLLLGRFRY